MSERLNILIVEDSEADALLAVQSLRRSQLEFDWARVETAAALQEHLAARSWDAVVSDYNLSRLSAPAALELVKASRLDIPFIVIVRSIGDLQALELFKAGAHDCVLKDERLTGLPEAVRREVLEAHQRARHREANMALKESEARYRSIFDQAAVGFANATLDGRLLSLNPRFCDMLGYSEAELLAKTVPEITHPEDREKIRPEVQRLFSGEIPYFFQEKRYLRKDGSVLWSSTGVSIVRDATGQPKHTLAVIRDIGDRKQAEVALQNLIAGTAATTGRDFFPALAEHIALALGVCYAVVTELQDDNTLHSLAFWAQGTPQPEFSCSTLDIPCGIALAQGSFFCARELRGAFPENPLLMTMGAESYLGIALRDRHGRAIGTLCILDTQPIVNPERARQILSVFAARAAVELERQRAEVAIGQQLAAIEAASEGIGILQGDTFLYLNQAHLKLFGYDSSDELSTWRDLYSPQEVARIEHEVLPILAAGGSWRGETTGRRKDGSSFAQEVSLTLTGNGLLICVFRDISERKQSERALRLLASVVESSEDAILTRDLDGTITSWNAAAVKLFGYGTHEAIGQNVALLVPPERALEVEDNTVRLAGGNRLDPYETVRLHKDGTRLDVSVTISPLKDETGAIVGFSKIVRDISARKRAEEALRASEERWQLAIDGSNDGIWDRSLADGNPFLSPRYLEMVGYSYDEVNTYEKWLALVHPDDLSRVKVTFQQCIDRKIPYYSCEYRLRRKDGTYLWLFARGKAIWDETGQPIRVVGSITDISDRKQSEQALRESEARYRLLAENTSDLVCLHALDRQYLFVSQSCQTLLGYSDTDMVGGDPVEFAHPEDRDRLEREFASVVTTGQPGCTTYRANHRQGHCLWLEISITPILDTRANVVRLQSTARDVTHRLEAQERLVYEARHDTLTGLPNRTALLERLNLCLQQAKRYRQQQFAILFLDLDRFKVINDSLGHACGDRVLVAVARRLTAAIRETDLAARLGGDEFVVLLTDIPDVRAALRSAERIANDLQAPIDLGDRDAIVGASIGIVTNSPHYTRADEALRDADLAMYRAKVRGGVAPRIALFDTEMHARALERLHLESDLRQALQRQEFFVEYQPIVALPSGQLVGLEALVRWQHPTRGRLSPGEFIHIAEETGTVVPLDLWVMQTACQDLATWHATIGASPRINVNLCARDLQSPDLLIAQVDRLLAATGLSGNALTLEITERMLVADIAETLNLFDRLKERDIHLSIDDFGTGYSSLSYLHQLPVDSLKIDRSFVSKMPHDSRSCEIIETLVTLSNRLGIEAIAEGIETAEQRDCLAKLGCEFGQGYYFAPPLQRDAILPLLQTTSRQLPYSVASHARLRTPDRVSGT